MSIIDVHQKGLALWTIPVAFVVAIVPSSLAVYSNKKALDPAMPRKFNDTVKNDESLDKETRDRIFRARSASENALETLGYHCAAVVAATFAGVNTRDLNVLACEYIALRIAYALVYTYLVGNRKLAPIRGLCWILSQAVTITLWYKAGKAWSLTA